MFALNKVIPSTRPLEDSRAEKRKTGGLKIEGSCSGRIKADVFSFVAIDR